VGTDLTLKCSCGATTGVAHNIAPGNGTRLVCHCDDCQYFARYLDKQDSMLDDYGAIEAYQLPMSRVEIHSGKKNLACARLRADGLYRWYTACCKTPVGATVSSKLATFGVSRCFIENDADWKDELVGAPRYLFATGDLPAERLRSSTPRIIARILFTMALWTIKRQHKPSAFYRVDGSPIAEPRILNYKESNAT